MTKHTHKNNPAEEGTETQEHYLAPAPPSKGKIYAIDQHPDVNAVAVVKGTTPHDMKTIQTKGNLNLAQLAGWLSANATRHDIILVEAGSGAFVLNQKLSEKGLSCTVLESTWVGQQADKYVDNDKLAAQRIARVYLQGNAKAVWIPDQPTIERRQLLHLHIKAKQDRTRALNSLRGFLTTKGIRPGNKTLSNARHQQWVIGQKQWTAQERLHLDDLIEQVSHTAKRSQKLAQQIATEAAQDKQMLALTSLPGIGVINAFSLIAAIGDIHRFKTPKKLAAYIGLNPNQKSSGNGKRTKSGVGNRGRKDIRSLLVQGAQAVLRQGSKCELGKWGMGLMLRKGNRNIAVSAIARKMAMQVWHLLMGNRPEWLETSKSRNTKFTKLLTTIGKEGRKLIGLPNTNLQCINHFNQIITIAAKE